MTISQCAPRLIACDIDGTLINPQHRVTEDNRTYIAHAVASGAVFSLSTGRPFRWIQPVLDQLSIRPLCVTSNGAVIYDSAKDQVIQTYSVQPRDLQEVVKLADKALAPHGGMSVAVERPGGSVTDPVEELFVVEPGYAEEALFGGFGVQERAEVLSTPASKLILRNSSMSSAAMYDLIGPLIDPSVAHVTYSMDEGMIEVAAAGITKARGVQWIAQHWGISQSETIAFGDMPNDIEMLQWVGCGYAMANAAAAVKEAADETTLSNEHGGVAHILQRWFGQN